MNPTMENLKNFLVKVENSSKLRAEYINCDSVDDFVVNRGSIVHIVYVKTGDIIADITTMSTDTDYANAYCFVVNICGNHRNSVFFKLNVISQTTQNITTCLNGAIDTLKEYPEYTEYANAFEELL